MGKHISSVTSAYIKPRPKMFMKTLTVLCSFFLLISAADTKEPEDRHRGGYGGGHYGGSYGGRPSFGGRPGSSSGGSSGGFATLLSSYCSTACRGQSCTVATCSLGTLSLGICSIWNPTGCTASPPSQPYLPGTTEISGPAK